MDKAEKRTNGLPIYDDINEEYAKASTESLKRLLTELTILRASSDKQLIKNLEKTYDNKRNEDGTITKLVGIYHKDQLTEEEADELLISGNATLDKMWVVEKYAEIAKQFK